MPRKNRKKKGPHIHGPTIFDSGFKQGCYGCAFAGQSFVCMTSDGKCLKGGADVQKEASMEEVIDAPAVRRTNRGGAER